jgi:hypothetical protein
MIMNRKIKPLAALTLSMALLFSGSSVAIAHEGQALADPASLRFVTLAGEESELDDAVAQEVAKILAGGFDGKLTEDEELRLAMLMPDGGSVTLTSEVPADPQIRAILPELDPVDQQIIDRTVDTALRAVADGAG